jgi:phosphoenolpyruvate carboxylase
VPGWYGIGSAIEQFVADRGGAAQAILAQLYRDSRVFRLSIDEVEKALAQTDLEIARAYAGLVENDSIRRAVMGTIEKEYRLTTDKILQLNGGRRLGERFPRFRRRLSRRLHALDMVNYKQVELLAACREMTEDDPRRPQTVASLLLSINCLAAGFGWTG